MADRTKAGRLLPLHRMRNIGLVLEYNMVRALGKELIEYQCGGKKKIYANSGTWIDNNSASDTICNFVVITQCPKKTCVGVYVYNEDGSVRPIPPSTPSSEESTSSGALLSR